MSSAATRSVARDNGTSDALAALARDEAELHDRAREVLGVAGRAEWAPWGAVLRVSGIGWYPLASLCAVAGAVAAVTSAPALLQGAIRNSLGPGAVGLLEPLGPVLVAAGALAALFTCRWADRVTVLRAAVVVAALSTVALALSTSSAVATVAACSVVMVGGASAVCILPILFDAHRPEVRMRVVAAYGAATVSGLALTAFATAVAGGRDLTWRGQLIVVALVPIAALVASWRLVDPGVGVHDTARLSHLVEKKLGVTESTTARDEIRLSTAEEFRRVVASESAPALLLMAAAYGMFAIAVPHYLDLYLRDRWTMVAPTRGLTSAALCLAALPAVAWYGHRGEIAARRSTAELLDVTSSIAVVAGGAFALAIVIPSFAVSVVLLALGAAGFVVLLVAASFGLLLLNEPTRRGHAAAALAIAVAAGGVIGRIGMATFGDRFGLGWALLDAAASLLVVARVGGAIRRVDHDLDALIDRQVERADLSIRAAHGEHVPLLACRHLDFSYGPVQVLFDVSFTVDDGEMVALLGTNGAGKSTLLRLISGLSYPTRGSIRLRGSDITFVDTDRRVDAGIGHVLGGRGVFGPLTVVDNLRAFAYTQGRDPRAVERGIDDAFAAFPRLAERRNQLAQTLSGGEQQMLAVAVAFVRSPQLLLIDELSLGLAPKVVGELLDMVRQVNARGTAVVLVEQSVNIALSVVERAYFMEKGEMRFDGAAGDLLARPDLLRSVFLEGARAAGAGAAR